MPAEAAAGPAAADRAFRDYRVVARKAESRIITSLLLAPVGAAAVPAYRPGQHLVFRLEVDGRKILRHYSISGDPAEPGLLRVSIKREPAPAGRPELPPGVGSGYMHDAVQVGDVLTAAGPMGQFQLDEAGERPVLLLSAGVGLTPMMSMLYRLVRASVRRVYFLHACDDGQVHAFAEEVRVLAAEREGVVAHFRYRAPGAGDLAAGRCHSQGLIDRQLLQALLPLDDYEVYLCGPPPFMQAAWRLLRGLGVAAGRIHYEFFGPATVLEADRGDDAAQPARAADEQAGMAAVPVPTAGVSAAASPMVSFGSSGVALPWDDACASLLELAEQAGLNPDFNCRAGLCNTCMSTLVSGAVDYFEEPLELPPQGKMLLCCSRPLGPVVIELAS